MNLFKAYDVELVGLANNTWTYDNGSFMFDKVPNGNYTLKITGNNCLTKLVSNVIVNDGDVHVSTQDSPIIVYQGDINADNVINMQDVVQISKAFNSKKGDANYKPGLDPNSDGVINMADIAIIAKNFNMNSLFLIPFSLS